MLHLHAEQPASERQQAACAPRNARGSAPVPIPNASSTPHVGPRDSTARRALAPAQSNLEPFEPLGAHADEPARETSHVTPIMRNKAAAACWTMHTDLVDFEKAGNECDLDLTYTPWMARRRGEVKQPDMSAAMRNTWSTGLSCDAAAALLVERPWDSILRSLPPPLLRHRFGV